jgi:hypothetical protein
MATFVSPGIVLDYEPSTDCWIASAPYYMIGKHADASALEGEIRAAYYNPDPYFVANIVKRGIEKLRIKWGSTVGDLPFLFIAGEGQEGYQVPDNWLAEFQAIAARWGWETYEREEAAC